MKVRLKPNLLILSGESEDEIRELLAWAEGHDDHAFWVKTQDAQTVRLTDLGPKWDACREPINVVSTSPDAAVRLISNFADTPFELDGRTYGSVEGFWQGLKCADEAKRREMAALPGVEARRAGSEVRQPDTFLYDGRTIRAGSPEHWALMARACGAKFSQHEEARKALLGTGERPLTHKTRHDSHTIPGVIMADIWMRIRRDLTTEHTIEDETKTPRE